MTLRRVLLTGPNGGALYIKTDGSGVASRMADAIEENVVDGARVWLAVMAPVLDADTMTLDEAKVILRTTMEHLTDVIAVAESRGERLDVDGDGGDEEQP
ncbi:hypothetical protein [Streptomyces sp. 900105755]